ncbi:sensor histidine kinase [Actinomyces bowdenii]|uniref:histidine kinase n=1 Tax=Actinomyces bowdenii TaxID=131109 RepID=A0A853EII3_9ACTO|nr:histidine kinase [Actinomyces bowdenii]MBF0696197.1 two-component sensor histidine kinase [Actinomyces bowdenii]MDO5063612.1 histidine kinase [Actinomyces bowdenii]NYS68370.1 two-component sensor histidine kinase [Actinomyces bowdenii]
MTALPEAAAPGASPYDWRRHCRTVPPGAAGGGLAAVDLAWGLLCLVLASRNLDFILDYGPHPVYVLNLGIGLVLALLQLLRLRLLRASLIATYTMLAAYALLVLLSPVNLGLDPIIITAVTSLHAVTRWEPDRRWGTAALLLALAGAVVNPASIMAIRIQAAGPGPALVPLTLISLAFVGTVVLTYLHASARRRAAESHAREVRAAALAATAAERLSMARELHDLVGHSLTAVAVQASTGLALGGKEQMRSALESVQGTASTSLDSVRELVRALRSQAQDSTVLADLRTVPELVGTARSAGRRVSAQLPAPQVLEAWNEQWSMLQRLTLVRLVGEAMTNALKHGGSPIRVRLGLEAGHCRLEVVNAAPPQGRPAAPGGPTGSGLIGLQERLRLVGGALEASAVELDGAAGFRLAASFPVNRPTGAAAGTIPEAGDDRHG